MMTTLTPARTLGELIRARREEKGWTQAELCYEARVPQTMISKVETGRSVPTLLVLRDLCKALDLEEVPLNLLGDKRRFPWGHLGMAS